MIGEIISYTAATLSIYQFFMSGRSLMIRLNKGKKFDKLGSLEVWRWKNYFVIDAIKKLKQVGGVVWQKHWH